MDILIYIYYGTCRVSFLLNYKSKYNSARKKFNFFCDKAEPVKKLAPMTKDEWERLEREKNSRAIPDTDLNR